MTIHIPAQYPQVTPTKIAFVGEAPSDEEIERGIPLVGPSGRVFNAMLRTANMDRADYMVTNVFDTKIPDNDVKNWCIPSKEAKELGVTLPPIGSAGYLHPDLHWHLDRLREELLDVRPTVVVPLGATALWAFTGDASISSNRGSITAAKYILPGVKLVPTFHPAHVIHMWKFFTIVVADFIKAKAEAERGPEIILPFKELLVEPTLDDIREYVPRLLASDLLSVDIETGWGQITCIGFAPDKEHAICIPFVDVFAKNRSYWPTVEDEVEAWGFVKSVVESGVPMLGQNFAGYDAYWLFKRMGIEPRNLQHDTRLMHHALYPELPKDLEFMGASYTQQGAWKNWGHRQSVEKRDD